ncbi:unnamed protein product, partial [Closterium sp. NIES-54]
MGANLVEMLQQLSSVPDDEVRLLHPDHTQASLRALLPRIRYFQEGACIVHDIIVQAVQDELAKVESGFDGAADVEVEIVFPVDSSAVASTKEDGGNNGSTSSSSSSGSGGNGKAAGSVAAAMLPVVPGVKGGEGCSVTGGCASCPYMK